MRERELGIVGLDVLEEQYIDIERARAKAHLTAAAVLVLDALALVQQVQRLEGRVEATTWFRNAGWSCLSWGSVS